MRKSKNWLKVVSLFVFAFMLMLPFRMTALGAGSGGVDLLTPGNAEITSVSAFETAYLTAGITESEGENWLYLNFDIELDNEYFEDFEAVLGELVFEPTDPDDPGYQAALDAACIGAGDGQLPPIQITFPILLGAGIDLPDGMTTSGTFNDGDLVITVYKLEKANDFETSRIVNITLDISKVVYAGRSDALAGGRLSIGVADDSIVDPGAEVSKPGDDITLTVKADGGDPDPGTEDSNYKLDKEVVARTSESDPHISFLITAQAEEESRLNGLTLKDQIPEELIITSVEVNYDEANPTFTDLPAADYTATGGLFKYTFPTYDESESNEVTYAQFKINTQLTLDQYKAFMAGQANGDGWSFPNQAFLYEDDKPNPVAKSEIVSAPFKGTFMEKEGKQVGVNGGIYEWTIEAETYFANSATDHVYLVDTIQGTDIHMYEESGNTISFKVNDIPRSAVKIDVTSLDPNDLYKYSALTAGYITSTLIGSHDAVYYTYGDQAVLIMALKDTDLNKPLEVTYNTRVVNVDVNAVNELELKNEVTMKWDRLSYDGPGGSGGSGPGGSVGDDDDFGFKIDKSVTANYTMIDKTAGTYTQKTRQMTWNITLNAAGKGMANVVVTDVLDYAKQQFVSLSGPDGLIDLGSDNSERPYYTLQDSGGLRELKIFLKDIDEDKVYTLTLVTEVVDPAILGTHNPAANGLTNKARVDYTDGDAQKWSESGSMKTPTNILLDKATVGTYDFDKHTLKWQITVNSNNVPLIGAVLTDTLPDGLTFEALTSVQRIPKVGDTETITTSLPTLENLVANKATITSQTGGCSIGFEYKPDTDTSKAYSQGELVFVFGDSTTTITDEFVFEFTTKVEDAYRNDKFITLTTHSFLNRADLTAKIADPLNPTITTNAIASDTATHTVDAPPVWKGGTYHQKATYGDLGQVDYIEWTIVLNKDAIDMSGVEISDTLHDWFELVPESLVIKAATTDADGVVTKDNDTDISGSFTFTQKNATGFNFTIPSGIYAKKPLIVTFVTLVVSDADAEDMTNSVIVKWGGNKGETPGNGSASGAKDFREESYASISTAPLLQISKTSSNSGYNGSTPLFKLAGAKFTLTPGTLNGTTWQENTALAPKVKVTNANGIASFFFLKKDIVYRLMETAASDGYIGDTAPHYYVFTDTPNSYPTDGSVTVLDTGTNKNAIKDIIINTPKDSTVHGLSFSFTKHTDGGKPLAGAEFELRYKNNQLKAHTAIKGAEGMFSFINVDPGTYTLVETSTPAGFITINPITVIVGEDNEVTLQGVPFDDEDGYIITNTYKRGQVSLIKTDSVDDGRRVSGAAFTVYAGGAAVARLLDNADGQYALAPLVGDPAKNSRGDAYLSQSGGVLQLLYGTYQLQETTTPIGYLPDNSWHTFEISTDGATVHIYNNDTGNAFTNEPCGIIQGQKNTENGKPLKDAVIGLKGTTTGGVAYTDTAISEVDGSFRFTDVPYGTYTISETSAPSSYLLNKTTKYEVTVDQNGSTITQDNTGKEIVIENERREEKEKTAGITIRKTSDDGVLKGFTFVITGKNGFYEEYTTNSNGRIRINGLKPGTYTVYEKETAKTVGQYLLPDAETVELTLDGEELDFHNKRVPPTTPPGPVDPNNPGPPGTNIDDPNVPGGTTNPGTPGTNINDPNVPGGTMAGGQSYGPKTGFSLMDLIWPLVFAISLVGLSGCLVVLAKGRK